MAKRELTDAELDAQIAKATIHSRATQSIEPRAAAAHYDVETGRIVEGRRT